MSDWVHIEPPAPRLTPVQERIREMMRSGKTFRQICVALMIRTDHLRDEIFEIRKYEVLMGKCKLTNEQRAAIYDAWKGGITQAELAKQYGVSEQAISQLCKKMGKGKAAAVNQAFEDAVNEMIEEMHAEETAKPEEIEQVTEPVVMTEEHTAEIPDAVISAVESKVADLRKEIQRNAEQAESLLRHNDNHIKRIEILEKWLSEVQDA